MNSVTGLYIAVGLVACIFLTALFLYIRAAYRGDG